MNRLLPLILALLLVLVGAGCGDDTTQPPPASGDNGLIQGEIGDADFEYVIDAAGRPGDPIEGPFVLRGTNLHYDDGLGALVVDLTVLNRGVFPHAEPIGLTFIDLIPASVTVLNPDNDIHGEGAAIVFAFANDDGVWSPGEASLPRTVQFGVEPGVSIGFIARLDIGRTFDGGVIGGLVWDDANENGALDEGEAGLAGVGVHLYPWSDEEPANTREIRFAVTGHDGRFAFEHLPAGAYVVSRMVSTADCFPTTPTEIRVLLVENDGDVADFLDANFGCVPQVVPPPPLVGTYVEATGKFYEPDVFVVFTLTTAPCPLDTIPPPFTSPDPGDVVPDCPFGTLRGPVTAIGREGYDYKIMNTRVVADAAMIPPPGISVGDRVDVRVHHEGNTAAWIVDSPIEAWDGPHEELRGRIQAFEMDPSGHVRILVLDTWLTMPDNTVIGR
ncbi:MAG TPA: SdrD B-like domain-containing protein [Candidatus Krumholzibacteria bacterium]|nr:SdrD B-like domain-containing protein [Candidatus Krumholzibacteria bacterium]